MNPIRSADIEQQLRLSFDSKGSVIAHRSIRTAAHAGVSKGNRAIPRTSGGRSRQSHPHIVLALAATLAVGVSNGACPMSEPPRSAPAAPARAGDVAVQEELDAARATSSVAAYELFVARHPGHPLEAVARAELERLKGAVPR